MLFTLLGNLIGGFIIGLRQSCLVLVPLMLAELALLAAVGGSLLSTSETILLMVAAVIALQGGYVASAFGPLFLARYRIPVPTLRRSH